MPVSRLTLHALILSAAACIATFGCMGTENVQGEATNSDGDSAQSAATPASPSPGFVQCAGLMTEQSAASTDMNPPTWTWARCNVASPRYRIGLDDANAATEVTATTFTPPNRLHVGSHTLYVARQKSDGTWSDVAPLTMLLLPRAQQGNITQDDPNVDGPAVYAYPALSGATVPPSALEVAGPNGFSADDILQGQLGDCYFAASLAAITEVSPTYLNTLVAPLTDGFGDPVVDDQNYPLYKITMHYPDASGAMVTWTMVTDAKLPTVNGDVAYAHPSADGKRVKIGIPLLEKGFAALDQSENFLNLVSQNGYSGALGYPPVGYGGWATYAFTALVGDAGQTVTTSTLTQTQLATLVAAGDTAAAVDVNNGYVRPPATLPSGATVTLNNGIYTYQPAGGGASFIVPNAHYYSLVSVAADGTTTLRNPWGGANNGQFSVPFVDLGPLFNRFTSVKLH